MLKRMTLLAAVLVFSASLSFAAEKPGSFHLFPYGGGWFGDEVLQSGWVAGGRLGFTFNRWITLEGGFEYSPNEFRDDYDYDGDVDVSFAYGDLAFSFLKSTKLDPYLLVGAGGMMYDADDDDPDNEAGLMWGLGLKYYMIRSVGLRLEAREVIIEDTPLNLVVVAGIEFRLGGSRPKPVEEAAPAPVVGDSDGDGVNDDADRCPDTPKGASVNTIGCPLDSDGDGVYDGIDQCPDTPKGATVNAKGCPADDDGDGVFNGLDQCPKTPKNTKVDAAGCTIVLDSDGDTVPDAKDSCPKTPPNTPVDATGCPEAAEMSADSDGDTVPDSADQCPHTSPGVQVDEKGCQIVEERLLLEGINFKTGSAVILPQSYKKLDSAAEILKANPQMKVEIQGYTDSRGKKASNVRLSNNRAKAVYTYLVKKGIPAGQMKYKGYGPDSPIAPNTTEEGRAKNRRIEFKVL